ncbi:MAG: hypothetical protein QOC66_2584 [Pseudonocardiales bacterium]|nr:hypothetical protein [Pseudonocardiales bacterium]
MDLLRETQRLRLDLLAVEVSRQLERSGIPHALLKGPSTANWLYDPPRVYNDVDVLVPLSRVTAAAAALTTAGIAAASGGGVGEEASHSLLMISSGGFEIDVHISLPALPTAGDRVWKTLASHLEPLDLGVGTVPALDTPGRCLVLALHALNRAAHPQAGEDLRRALVAAGDESWARATDLAASLGAADLFDAGLSTVADSDRPMSRRAYLYASGAPSAALGLQRLREARRRELPRLILREVVPTRGFMVKAYPGTAGRRFGLLRAHLLRWKGLVKALPGAVRAVRAAGPRRRS